MDPNNTIASSKEVATDSEKAVYSPIDMIDPVTGDERELQVEKIRTIATEVFLSLKPSERSGLLQSKNSCDILFALALQALLSEKASRFPKIGEIYRAVDVEKRSISFTGSEKRLKSETYKCAEKFGRILELLITKTLSTEEEVERQLRWGDTLEDILLDQYIMEQSDVNFGTNEKSETISTRKERDMPSTGSGKLGFEPESECQPGQTDMTLGQSQGARMSGLKSRSTVETPSLISQSVSANHTMEASVAWEGQHSEESDSDIDKSQASSIYKQNCGPSGNQIKDLGLQHFINQDKIHELPDSASRHEEVERTLSIGAKRSSDPTSSKQKSHSMDKIIRALISKTQVPSTTLEEGSDGSSSIQSCEMSRDNSSNEAPEAIGGHALSCSSIRNGVEIRPSTIVKCQQLKACSKVNVGPSKSDTKFKKTMNPKAVGGNVHQKRGRSVNKIDDCDYIPGAKRRGSRSDISLVLSSKRRCQNCAESKLSGERSGNTWTKKIMKIDMDKLYVDEEFKRFIDHLNLSPLRFLSDEVVLTHADVHEADLTAYMRKLVHYSDELYAREKSDTCRFVFVSIHINKIYEELCAGRKRTDEEISRFIKRAGQSQSIDNNYPGRNQENVYRFKEMIRIGEKAQYLWDNVCPGILFLLPSMGIHRTDLDKRLPLKSSAVPNKLERNRRIPGYSVLGGDGMQNYVGLAEQERDDGIEHLHSIGLVEWCEQQKLNQKAKNAIEKMMKNYHKSTPVIGVSD